MVLKGKQGLKVLTKFYRIITKDGKPVVKSLTGEQRKDTQKMIESYIGTYENCISTIISLQNRDMGMIDMKQTDRKHFLSSILKLDILEQQYNSANQQYKEVDTEYKYLTKDYQNNSKNLKKEIETIVSELECQENELLVNTQNKEVIQQKYESLLAEMVSVEKMHFENLTKEELHNYLQETVLEIGKKEFEIENNQNLKEYLLTKINNSDVSVIISKKEENEKEIETVSKK